MNVPLGHAIGNALEVCEAIEVLKGGGPDDLRTICLTLASIMVKLSCKISIEEARERTADALKSGKAYNTFCRWIKAQGGDDSFALDPERFGKAKYEKSVISERDGYVSEMAAEKIGTAAMILGAGRATADDVIDVRAGIILNKKTGDKVSRGEVIATLYTEREGTLSAAEKMVLDALSFTENAPKREPLIYDIIE